MFVNYFFPTLVTMVVGPQFVHVMANVMMNCKTKLPLPLIGNEMVPTKLITLEKIWLKSGSEYTCIICLPRVNINILFLITKL